MWYITENFTIQPLIPNSQYHLTIQTVSVQYPLETFSEMDIFALSEFVFAKMILYNVNVLLHACDFIVLLQWFRI